MNSKTKKLLILLIICIILIIGIVTFIKIRKKPIVGLDTINNSEYIYFVNYDKEGKVGVIDKTGKSIITPQYTDVYIPNPTKDIFICFTDEVSKIINSSGDELLTQYENISALATSESILLEFEKDVLKYKKDGMYGLISLDGTIITPAAYDEVSSLSDRPGRILVKKDDKVGVIDTKGNIVIPISYLAIKGDGYYSNQDGYLKTGYIVSEKTKTGIFYGYYNNEGKKVIDLKYDSVERVHDDDSSSTYLIVMNNGRKGVFKDGKKIVDFNYEGLNYSNLSNIFIVEKTGKYGFIDREGHIILEPKFSSYEIAGDYIYVADGETKELYDINGNFINNRANYSQIFEVENTSYFIGISSSDQTYKIISKDKEIANNYKLVAYLFDNYFAFTDQNDKCGVIDASKGKEIIPATYVSIIKVDGVCAIEARDEKYAATIYSSSMEKVCTMNDAIVEIVTREGKENYAKIYNKHERIYIDVHGKTADNKVIYEDKPLVSVCKDGKWGFANKSGEMVVEAKYDMVTELNEYGFAGILKDNKWGVVDLNGNIIVEPKYEIETYYFPSFIGENQLIFAQIIYTEKL